MALQFDGTNDFANKSGVSFHPGTAFSYEFKLYYGFATSSVSEKAMMGDDDGGGGGSVIFQRNGETMRLYLGTYAEDSSTTTLVQNTWYDVYLGHDSANDKTYFGLDGTVREVANTANHSTGATGFYLARGYNGYFSGIFDELRISSVIRHTGNYTPNETRFEVDGDTVALYHFLEGSGTTAADETSNGYDLTLGADTAAPTWVDGYSFTTSSTGGIGIGMLGIS